MNLPFSFFNVVIVDFVRESNLGVRLSQTNQGFQLPRIGGNLAFAAAQLAHFHIPAPRETLLLRHSHSQVYLRADEQLARGLGQVRMDKGSCVGDVISK